MPGVFDRLNKEIENKQKEGGITALDLADLPAPLRKIMKLMLRELQMTYPRLCEVMDAMPVNRFHFYESKILEYFVTYNNHKFNWQLNQPSSVLLSNALQTIQNNYL